MGEIVQSGIKTKLPLDPDAMLEANKGKFTCVLIIGFGHDAELITASSTSDLHEMNMIIDLAMRRILTCEEELRE